MAELVRIGRAAPVPDVVEVARDLLRRAEAGQLRSLAYIAETGDGSTMHGATEIADVLRAVGICERLKFRFLAELDASAGDPGEPD